MSRKSSEAPRGPGSPPYWNPGAKGGVGTAPSDAARVWFTLGRGVLEETYYPRIDTPRVRDLGLAVTDGDAFFSWEKADARADVAAVEPGVPAYRLTNHCRHDRYRVEKEVFAHPDRPAVVQRVAFHPAGGAPLRLYALLNPHLSEKAVGWVGDYKGVPMLFAAGAGAAVALACSAPWGPRSVGFVGKSDGWQQLSRHRRLVHEYDRAEGGNVALAGEIGYAAGESFLLALGFGADAEGAGLAARAALLDGFDEPLRRYVQGWKDWQAGLRPLCGKAGRRRDVYRASTAVLRTHLAKVPPGAAVASLAIPFGQVRTGDDTGGYHLVWPRDLAETGGGLLAAGDRDHTRDTLNYLAATQDADGRWPQNSWVSGKPHWTGVQLDEAALPVLLLDLALREDAITDAEADHLWPMVRRAAGFLVRTGPYTPEDRWEHDGGYSPFTLGAGIAALLVAAERAAAAGEPRLTGYLRDTADIWYAGIDRWTYLTGTPLAKRLGIDGFYVRLGHPRGKDRGPRPGGAPRDGAGPGSVSPDALALVRFGLRSAADPRVLNTVKAIDAVVKVDLGYGPGWRRYPEDHYGEYPDGRGFDDRGGVGRAWPLLAGERGHYELAAGRPREAERMLTLMEEAATATGLIPEQVWDAGDFPEKGLCRGRPTTSACPLAWAHAEYVKLLRSLRDGAVFDLPPQTARRYGKPHRPPHTRVWRQDFPLDVLPGGFCLRVEVPTATLIRWRAEGAKDWREAETTDTGLDWHFADLPTDEVPPGGSVVFRIGNDEHRVVVGDPEPAR